GSEHPRGRVHARGCRRVGRGGATAQSRARPQHLSLNDGLVEILGAVSGFFAAFGNSAAVLVAGVTVAELIASPAGRSGTWRRGPGSPSPRVVPGACPLSSGCWTAPCPIRQASSCTTHRTAGPQAPR